MRKTETEKEKQREEETEKELLISSLYPKRPKQFSWGSLKLGDDNSIQVQHVGENDTSI